MISPDGNWWWNGSEWVSAVSADGRWRWDGRQWALNTSAIQYVGGPTRLEDTPDTARTQMAVIAFQILEVIVGGLSLYVIGSNFSRYLSQATPANSTLDPATMTAFVQAFFVIAAVIGLAWRAVMIAGAFFKWRWIYYAAMALGAFSVYSLLTNALTLAGLQQIHPPVWLTSVSIAVEVLNIALAAWLLVLWLRYRSAWARRSVQS